MKKDLIEVLYKEFKKDKETIKQNLLHYIDTIRLETSDEYGKLTLIIAYERRDKNETTNN